MKRFLLKILLFFSILAVLDVIYGKVCGYLVNKASSGETAALNHVLKQEKYDIMLMGSSRCVCHYDDKMMSDSLHLKVINAGYKGNGIVLMYGRYHIMPKDKKPKYLIYDIEPSFDYLEYNDDKDRRYLSGLKMFYGEPGISDVFKSVDALEPIKMNSYLYRYNSEVFTLIYGYFGKGQTIESFYLPTHKDYVNLDDLKIDPASSIDLTKIWFLEKLMLECREDNVELIIVASPKFGASSTTVLKPVVDLCEKYDVPFWDYYLDMHDVHWFCDNMHLNYEGSQEFSKTIIQRIKKNIIKNNNK